MIKIVTRKQSKSERLPCSRNNSGKGASYIKLTNDYYKYKRYRLIIRIQLYL